MITTQPVLGGMLFSRMLTLTILNNNESRLSNITFSVPYLLPTPDYLHTNDHFQLFTYLNQFNRNCNFTGLNHQKNTINDRFFRVKTTKKALKRECCQVFTAMAESCLTK